MGYGMLLGSLLFACLILGYALLVWIFAAKESGWVKVTGQTLAVIIAVVVIILFLFGGYKGMRYKGSMMSGCMMGQGMKQGMMEKGMMGKGMMGKGMHNKMMGKDRK